MAKRQRERQREARQEAKRERREKLAAEAEVVDEAEQERLMDQFRVLSEQHAAGHVSPPAFRLERHRILTELGIEQPEDPNAG